MPHEIPEFYSKLRFQQRLLLLLLAILWGFALLGVFSVIVIAADMVGKLTPIREPLAWTIISTTGLVSSVLGLIGLGFLFLRRPGTADMARAVEARHPELRETLSTAVEIQEKYGCPSNPLEEALFRQVEQEAAAINLRRASLPRILHPLGILLFIGASMLLSDFAAQSRLADKARFYRLDQVQGQATGLIVKPGEADVPRGGDLRITASVERWEKDPVIRQRLPDGSLRSYPMMPREGGVFDFTLYDINQALAYQVQTSSLESPWFSVQIFDPPTFEAIEIHTQPPAYTREESASFSRFIDLHVPEGSTLTFRIQTHPGVQASFNLAGERTPMEPSGESNNEYIHRLTARRDSDYQIQLRNQDGRTAVSHRHQIKVIPDNPPVIDIIEPGRDTSVRPDGAVPLTLFAADDYGLTRIELHVSISGLPRTPIVLFEAREETPRERELLAALEATGLLVEHGDIIAYHAVAWDNREPTPRSSRSDIFFVEVLTDVPDQDSDDQDDQGQGDEPPEEINLRALIVELKRLIRQNHAAESLTGQRRADTLQQTGADLAAVKTEAREILSKIGGLLLQAEGGAFFDLFRNALVRVDDAERLVNEDAPQQAIPPLSEALSNFVLIESYLKSLPQPPQGMASGGESEPTAGSSSGEGEQESQGPRPMDTARMQEALEQINQLVDRQNAQNQTYRQSAGRDIGERERQELSQSQDALSAQVRDLEQQLRRLDDSHGIRGNLRNAGREMGGASQASNTGQIGQAERAGLRARESLIEAASLLDDRLREAAAGAIMALSQQAEALAQQQEMARQASQEAQSSGSDAESTRDMRRNQDALRQQLEQLLARAEREAVNLTSAFPEAGEALSRASRDASQANTAGEMQRASNALLYERFGPAARHQGEAAGQLEQLAQALSQSLGELPPMSPTELRRLLGQIEATRQAVNEGEGNSGQSDSQIQRTADSLGSAGRTLGNQNLVELGENLEASAQAGNAPSAGVTQSLDRASRILQEYLRAGTIEQRLRLNRDSAPPPEKYRTLVEEYFKRLAEEP